MLMKLWTEHGWIILVIILLIPSILAFIPTGRIIRGFHRGVYWQRKETYDDIILGIISIILWVFTIYAIVRFIFSFFNK
jgi:hypothetical protein